jgi:hypothetical protein
MKKSLLCLALGSALLVGCKPAGTGTTTTATTPDGTTVTTTVTTNTPADNPPTPPPAPPTMLTQASLDRVMPDMSKAEVEAILGQPTSSNDQPIPIVGGTQTTFNYQAGNSAVTIVFKNDKMKEKSGTFNP